MTRHLQYILSSLDRDHVFKLASELAGSYRDVENKEFQLVAPIVYLDLPISLLKIIHQFKQIGKKYRSLTIKGLMRENLEIPPTPDHWRNTKKTDSLVLLEFAHYIVSQTLGQPFSWKTHQDCKLSHDIIPIKGHEYKQVSSASVVNLQLHMDECFDNCQPDFLSLFCLRNNENIPTIVSDLEISNIPDAIQNMLFEEKFFIVPDDTHLHIYNNKSDSESFQNIKAINDRAVAIFWGNRFDPFLRFDPSYTDFNKLSSKHKDALSYLTNHLLERQVEIILSPGDLLFVDNYHSVHGRKGFEPLYNGNDRWLKRIDITTDIRKSADRRTSLDSLLV